MRINIRGGKTTSDEVIDFVIQTYSNEGETVLDMCCHNTVVGDRVKLLKRNFRGWDLKFDFDVDEQNKKEEVAAEAQADRNVDQSSDSDTKLPLLGS